MIRKLLAAAAVAASLFGASSASAAQVVDITDRYESGAGQITATGSFQLPDPGLRAFVDIYYSGGEMLPDTQFSFLYSIDYTYWDSSGGGFINTGHFVLEVICSVANRCIDARTPGHAFSLLAPPPNWVARTCNESTGSYCSQTFRPFDPAQFVGVFGGAGDNLRVSIHVSDFFAVPEPATWAMMIIGFGMTGAALRRQTAMAPAPMA